MTISSDQVTKHILEANGLDEDVDPDTVSHLELVMDRKVGLFAFEPFKNLKSLYLVNQKLESLFAIEEFGGLPNLEKLFLNENRFTSLAGVSSCESLKELHAPFNQITTLGSCIIDLRRLRVLNVAHNRIMTFTGLPSNLIALNIACNLISDDTVVSAPYRLSRSLRTLNLASNPITCMASVTRLLSFSTHLAEINFQDQDFGACPVSSHYSYRSFALSLASASLLVLDKQAVLSEECEEAAKLFSMKERFYAAREISVDIAFRKALAQMSALWLKPWLLRAGNALVKDLRREFESAGTLSTTPRFTPVSAVQQIILDGIDGSVKLVQSINPEIVRVKVLVRNIYKINNTQNISANASLLFAVNNRPGLYSNNILLADPAWLQSVLKHDAPTWQSGRAIGGQAVLCRVATESAEDSSSPMTFQEFLIGDGKATGLAPGISRRVKEGDKTFLTRAKEYTSEKWRLDFDLVLSKEDRPGERVIWRLDSDETAWTARFVESSPADLSASPAIAAQLGTDAEALQFSNYFKAPRFSQRGVLLASFFRPTGIAWNKDDCKVAEGDEHSAEVVEIAGGISPTFSLVHFSQLKVVTLANCEITSFEVLANLPVSIEQLSVAGNRLGALPRLTHLSNLLRLDASGNSITRLDGIPEGIKWLRLDRNKISDGSLETLAKATSVEDLYLGLNRISEKRSLLKLKVLDKLEILDLSANPCVQEESYKDYIIFHLRSLKMLDGCSVLVADQRGANERIGGSVTLEFLEDRVGQQLAHVVSLELKSCRLRHLGSIINQFHFPNLVELLLDSNMLSSVKGVGCLPNLSRLSLNGNRFESLNPAIVGSLDESTTLSVLELNGNKLTSLSDLSLFCDVSKLRVLHCIGNELNAVEGLAACARLKEINVERNKIRLFDNASITGLTKSLVNLYAADNAMKSLGAFKPLTRLQTLNFSMNRIADIAEVETLSAMNASLKNLCLLQNPLSRRHMYRLSVIKCLPFLDVLDEKEVVAEERIKVEQIAGAIQSTIRIPPLSTPSNLLPILSRRVRN